MVKFEQSMRWFGPGDPVSLRDIRQAGCTSVVTALHHIPVGAVWSKEEILKRRTLIEQESMKWLVVESLPVHEEIKTRTGDHELWLYNYIQSLKNLSECGIKVVTYNFMPVLDWMRTNPAFTLPNGSKTLYFEKLAFIVFELFLLQRPFAEQAYTDIEIAAAKEKFSAMTATEREQLFQSTLLGLPGSDEAFTPEIILDALQSYAAVDASVLRSNLHHFLQEIIPIAENCGMKMAVHPDDPPYPILGLPRIVSTEADLDFILNAYPSQANGLCFCTGSLGVRTDNDLCQIISKYGAQIHFVHLRNIHRDEEGNFYEAEHLNGVVDMYSVMKKLIEVMQQTRVSLPLRPDHGHQMLDDLQKTTYPGYSAIGRLKGLAELRGLEMGISRSL